MLYCAVLHNLLLTFPIHYLHYTRTLPGEANLWTQLESHVSRRTLEKHTYDYSSGDSRYNHNMPERNDETRNRHGHQPSAPNCGTSDDEGVHMVTHIGNFISVDRFLRAAAVQLLHEICNDDVAVEVWKDQIHKIETKLREHYRSTLSENPAIRRALRLCGHVFLCGPSEAGGSGLNDLFASFFAATIASPGPPVDEEALSKAREDSQTTHIASSHEQQEEEEKEKEEGEKDTTEEEEKEEQQVWKSVGEAANADRENRYNYTLRLTKDQRQAAKLVHGMLLRVAR